MARKQELLMAVRAALAGIDTAYGRAAAQVDAEADLDAAHAVANELAGHLRGLANDAAEVRTRTVSRIWAAERLSLSALGDRIGVSKTRARQLLRAPKLKGDKSDG